MVKDFDERIRALALTMGETYQVLQKLNPDESMYSPVFENVKAQLRAIHATEPRPFDVPPIIERRKQG